jgi:hypothetical protein
MSYTGSLIQLSRYNDDLGAHKFRGAFFVAGVADQKTELIYSPSIVIRRLYGSGRNTKESLLWNHPAGDRASRTWPLHDLLATRSLRSGIDIVSVEL